MCVMTRNFYCCNSILFYFIFTLMLFLFRSFIFVFVWLFRVYYCLQSYCFFFIVCSILFFSFLFLCSLILIRFLFCCLLCFKFFFIREIHNGLLTRTFSVPLRIPFPICSDPPRRNNERNAVNCRCLSFRSGVCSQGSFRKIKNKIKNCKKEENNAVWKPLPKIDYFILGRIFATERALRNKPMDKER
jgi:hypothetical protein